MRFYADRFSIGASKFDKNFKLDLQAVLEHRPVPDVSAFSALAFWRKNNEEVVVEDQGSSPSPSPSAPERKDSSDSFIESVNMEEVLTVETSSAESSISTEILERKRASGLISTLESSKNFIRSSETSADVDSLAKLVDYGTNGEYSDMPLSSPEGNLTLHYHTNSPENKDEPTESLIEGTSALLWSKVDVQVCLRRDGKRSVALNSDPTGSLGLLFIFIIRQPQMHCTFRLMNHSYITIFIITYYMEQH